MVSFRHPAAVCALLATVAVLGAACGGSSKSAPASSNSTVATADSGVGSILVDRQGETLYLFAKDRGGASACSGACAKAWPPYAAKGAALHVGSGLKASLLKSMTRADGTKQLTVSGSPLYTFAGKPAGDVSGQGVGGFYVVQASGKKYDPGAASGS